MNYAKTGRLIYLGGTSPLRIFLKFLFLSSVRRENNDGRDLAYNFYILRYSRGAYIQLKSTKVRGPVPADKVRDA